LLSCAYACGAREMERSWATAAVPRLGCCLRWVRGRQGGLGWLVLTWANKRAGPARSLVGPRDQRGGSQGRVGLGKEEGWLPPLLALG
jgi:hypothetical protein